jgi:hypothetical protein
VSELEALLAGMRAREYKQDLVAKHGGGQLSIMQVCAVGWVISELFNQAQHSYAREI